MTNPSVEGVEYTISEQNNKITFTINTTIYPLRALYGACYLFIDNVYIFLDGDPKKEITVTMKFKDDSEKKDYDALVGEFYNELLNQLLREKINEHSGKVREYIVSQALYNAVPNEVDELLKEVEEEDWQEDPLGIAKPWSDNSSSEEGADPSKSDLNSNTNG